MTEYKRARANEQFLRDRGYCMYQPPQFDLYCLRPDGHEGDHGGPTDGYYISGLAMHVGTLT